MFTTAVLKHKAVAIYRSKSMRQGSVLFAGRAGAQVVALLSYPLLARWYSPAQFGEFALFSSILSILLVGASGRYEEALVLSRRPKQANKIFQLSQLYLLGFVLLLSLSLLFPPVQVYFLKRENLSSTFYLLIPLLVLCGGYWQIVQNWLIRHQQFTKLSLAVFLQRLLIFSGAAAAVFFSWSTNGLMLGLVMGCIFIFLLGLAFQRQKIRTPLKQLTAVADNYRDFPLYSVPTVLVHLFIFHLPVLWLSFFDTNANAGNYSMAFTLLMVPITALRISFIDVFYQRMAQSDDRERIALFIRYSKSYGLLLVPGMFLLMIFGQDLLPLVLGQDWQTAGEMASHLAPLMLIIGITDLAMTSLQVRKKLKTILYLHSLQLMLWGFTLYAGFHFSDLLLSFRLMCLSSFLVLTGALAILYKNMPAVSDHPN